MASARFSHAIGLTIFGSMSFASFSAFSKVRLMRRISFAPFSISVTSRPRAAPPAPRMAIGPSAGFHDGATSLRLR
jgi:hypothetical protein